MERDFSYVTWPELCQMVASGLRELEKQGLGVGLDQRRVLINAVLFISLYS